MDSTEGTHSPSIRETAFDCPHCGAYTTQYWYRLHASPAAGDRPIPLVFNEESVARARNSQHLDQEARTSLIERIQRYATGDVLIEPEGYSSSDNHLQNLHISQCYNCKKISVWRHMSLIYPTTKVGPPPNRDLPVDIRTDYEEARSIVNESPRGAAALLRLCVQKLCAHLGEGGEKLYDDIGRLVAKGLNPMVHDALDVVRVIGNEAVHPGAIDLRDDRETALRLFELVNIIVEQMISHPKMVRESYDRLPDSKKQDIEERNRKAKEEQ